MVEQQLSFQMFTSFSALGTGDLCVYVFRNYCLLSNKFYAIGYEDIIDSYG